MENLKINIDKKGYKSKPNGEFGKISANVSYNRTELTLEDFADQVGNKGKAFTRALLKDGRTAINFVQQRLLVLDFDEEPEHMIGYQEFKERCTQYGLPFAFTYKTFSYDGRKKIQKFRAVFVLDSTITDMKFAQAINVLFQKVFPEADSSCTDLPRLFLGGKGLMDTDYDARVNVMNIVHMAEFHMKKIYKQNFAERARTVAKKIKGVFIDGTFGFYKKEDVNFDIVNGEWIEQGGIIMLCAGSSTEHMHQTRENIKTKKMIKGYTRESLEKYCPLLAEFSQHDISHQEKFLLATNLNQIQGGKKIFFENLRSNEEKECKIDKWKRDWEKNIDGEKPYAAQRCRGICAYENSCKCDSLCEKLGKKIKKTTRAEEYFTLSGCEDELESCLNDAIQNRENALHVIVAQTGLGKTEIYCRKAAEMTEKKFLIAVPTCKLQDEVIKRLEEKGVACYKTESRLKRIEKLGMDVLWDRVQELYEKGFENLVKKIINDYRIEYDSELSDFQKEELKKLTMGAHIPRERCIVTTHAFFLMMDLQEFEDYEIIIDEDILVSLFKRNGAVTFEDIQKAEQSDQLFGVHKKALDRIMNLKDGETCKMDTLKLNYHQKENLYKSDIVFHSALPLLLESSCVAMDKKEKQVLFFDKKELPERKMIIVSASADRKLYEDYFCGRTICFRKIHHAKYVGKIKQYTIHTMSRECIKKSGVDIIFKKIREITGEIPIITFKMFGKSDIYFGKTEGFDEYAGKDIAIIGTPHSIPLFYKLIGEALGYQTRDELHNHRISRNGYDFPIMTFEGEEMQNLQLFFIETELEQAIGRSRLLRNKNTVYVFSNYPCEQAELLQEDYLPEMKEEEIGK